MQVKCTLCDRIDTLMDSTLQAKRLRNRRINMYLCKTCYDRIDAKTKERHATGKFRLYEEKRQDDQFI
ncbi:YlaI family protein [Oceanobacillus salinisoli]|uniref:YlaI family protein n=1 Tax=Oceanobacillus salinisoli TaxID=2678611 RepID=UPI0012E2C1D5|nr:YlaI family protein [Oceanobacillus salinisoli]